VAAGAAHDTPPDTLVGWRGGHPLAAFGTSILASSALAARRLFSRIYGIPTYIFIAIHHWEQGRQLAKAGPVADYVLGNYIDVDLKLTKFPSRLWS